jgi:hypothetical protein
MSVESQSVSVPKKKVSLVLLVAVLIPVLFALLHFCFGISIPRAAVITIFMNAFVVYFRLHLSHEKPLVLYIIGVALIFFICMILLFWVSHWSMPQGSEHVS